MREVRPFPSRCAMHDASYYETRRAIVVRLALLVCFLSIGGISPATAQEASRPSGAVPPGPTHYLGREIAKTMHYLGAPWLVRESRQREEDAKTLLEVLQVQPGWTVCDLGCGNGYHALPLARRVGEQGKVLAVDIQSEMLRLLAARAEEAGVENIEPLLGTAVDPKLPPGAVDLILLVDVYHELSHPEQMLAAMRASLKPEGRIVLVEFRAEDPEVPIKPLHKMSKAQILKEMRANAFELDEEFDELPWQHVMFFRRAAVEKEPTSDGIRSVKP